MLLIRNEQMKIFKTELLETFIKKTQAHIHEVFEEQIMDKTEEDIREIIQNGIEKARGYEIREEQAVVLFIDLIIGIGPDFEEQKPNKWMISILEREDMIAQEKMDFIYARLSE